MTTLGCVLAWIGLLAASLAVSAITSLHVTLIIAALALYLALTAHGKHADRDRTDYQHREAQMHRERQGHG